MNDYRLTFPLAKTQLPSVIGISSEPLNALWQESGPVFGNTIFYAERQGTENTHLCLASDLIPPGSDKLKISPRLVDFDIYCELLKEEDVLDKDFHLGFIDTKGKRIPIKNQMMFHAAVIYQVTQKADMITFSSEPISKTATALKTGSYPDLLSRKTSAFFNRSDIITPSFLF